MPTAFSAVDRNLKRPYFQRANLRSRGSYTADLSLWEKQLLLSIRCWRLDIALPSLYLAHSYIEPSWHLPFKSEATPCGNYTHTVVEGEHSIHIHWSPHPLSHTHLSHTPHNRAPLSTPTQIHTRTVTHIFFFFFLFFRVVEETKMAYTKKDIHVSR